MKTLLLFLLIAPFSFSQNYLGEIRGTIVDENDEPLPFARVLIYSDVRRSKLIGGAESDFDGRYAISAIPAGSYEVVFVAHAYGMDTLSLTEVEILPEKITNLDTTRMKMDQVYHLPRIPAMIPVIQLNGNDPFGRSITIESEDIRRH